MKKPIYFLFGILLIFIIVYFLLVQKEKKTYSPGKVENFLQLDSASVDRIEFKKFDTKLVFQKSNQQWHIVEPDSYRADNDAIGQLLSTASHLEVGEIISSNKEKQFLFQVDTVTGTGLVFFAGENQLASVVMGKMSSDYLHAYLRKTDSDDVYLARGHFTRIANRKINQWRDRGIFTFRPTQISEIELGQGQDKFKLTKEDTLWQLSQYPYKKSSVADGKVVENYIKTLANINADDFAEKSEIGYIDFQILEFSLKLTFLDGHEEELFVTRKHRDDNRYFAKTDQEKNVFVLFEYTFNRLAKKFEEFQPGEET